MTFAKEELAGYLANHMARLFERALQARIKPLGLTTGYFPALLELWREDGLTQRELVRRLDIEQATMANTLTRMERDGLVTRKPHPTDGRAQQVWLTEKARKLEDPAIAAAESVNASALSRLDDAQREAFLGLTTAVVAALRGAEADEA